MKFVVSSTELSERLQTLNRAINTKNAMPILSNILIEVGSDKQITMTASDAEVRISTKFDAIESEGNITVTANAKALLEAVKAIPEQPITIHITDNLSMTLQYQNGKFTMMGESADEYPKWDETGEYKMFSLPAPILAKGIGRAQKAAADDVLRPQLSCVFFDIKGGTISMVASDGTKLAATGAVYNTEEDSTLLLPKKAALITMGIALKSKEEVKIHHTARNARIEMDNYIVYARLLEARFPNWRSVIPANNDKVATIDKDSLAGLLRRVMVFANPNSTLVKMHFEENKVHVTSQDVDYGKAAEEVLVCDYTDAPITIGFKGEALSEMLSSIDTKDVSILMSDPSRAGILTPSENKEGEKVTLLLMPMSLQ